MLPAPSATILVSVLSEPRDLEIARLLGWYRIPLRRVPRLVFVDFLAFYQPGSFGALGGQIAFIAPVIGNELTTREELLKNEPDHPRAREEYFKIQLGSLVRLPEPIRAERWRRFSFFYTTGEYMLRARTIAELVVRGEDRRIVWNALRERAVQGSASGTAYAADAWPEEPGPNVLDEILALIAME